MVVGPERGAGAQGRALNTRQAGDIFIGRHQIDRVTVQAGGLNQAGAIGDQRQRRGQGDTALEVVDLIILRGRQQGAAQHDAGILVTDLGPQALGTLGDVLAPQVEQRSAGAPELFARLQRPGFGGEGFQGRAALAVFGRGLGIPDQIGAVEPAAVLGQLGAGPGGLEVAPHDVGAVVFDADEELPLGRRIVDAGAVVAIDRIVAIGIDPPQQIGGILGIEVREQVLDWLLAGVGASGQQVLPEDLALQIEGQPTVERGLFVVVFGVRGDDRGRTGGATLAGGQVGDRHVEPVLVGDGEVALEAGDPAVRLGHRHDNLVRTGGKDLAEHELAVFIDRYGDAHGGDRLARLDALAADSDRTAGSGDVLHLQAGFAIAAQVVTVGAILQVRIGAIKQREPLQRRLVEAALSIIDPQQIAQVLRGAGRRGPLGVATDLDGHNGQRRGVSRLAAREDADLGRLKPPGIVGVGAPGHRLTALGQGRNRPDVESGRDVQRVVLDLNVGAVEGDIDAALTIRFGLGRVAGQRLAIDTDGKRQAGPTRWRTVVRADQGRHGRWSGWPGRLDLFGERDPNLGAAVEGHPFGRLIAGDWRGLAHAVRREPLGRQTEAGGEIADHDAGPRFGQRLIGRERGTQRGGDALVVGVADDFEADLSLAHQTRGQLGQRRFAGRAQHVAAGLERRVVQAILDGDRSHRRQVRRGRRDQSRFDRDDAGAAQAGEDRILAFEVGLYGGPTRLAVVDPLAERELDGGFCPRQDP